MPLRDWKSSTIRKLWLWGLAAEAALIMLPYAWNEWRFARLVRMQREHAEADARLPPAMRDSIRRAAVAALDSLGIGMTTSGDTLSSFAWNDSQVVTLRMRADTIQSIRMTPAAERAVGQALAPVVPRLIEGLVWVSFWYVVIVYLPIPVALCLLTVAWDQTRYRSNPPPIQSADA